MDIVAIQVAAEQAGFERARLTEQELVSTLTRSLSELRTGLQKQHENDLDAISEEAVKVTNRLKAKLTAIELKSNQTEEYNSQLMAMRVKDEAENIRIRQRLLQLESGLKGREEISKEIQMQSVSESARDVAQMTSKMEGVKDKLIAEIDSLRLSEREHRKAFQVAINERDSNMNERQKKYKYDIEKLELQVRETSSTLVRLTNDLKDSQECSNKDDSSLMFELKRSVEKSTNEKSILVKDLNSVKEQNALLERSLHKFEKRTMELEQILSEEKRKADLKECSLATTKNLLLKAEQRLSQLDSTQGRNSDLESAVIKLQGIQEAAHTAAQMEIAELREKVLISRTYAEGLLVQLGELQDRDREREREREKAEQDDRRGQGEESDRRGGMYSAERSRAKSPYHQSKQPHPMSASSVTLAATRPYSYPSQSTSSYPSSSSSSSQYQSQSQHQSSFNHQTPDSSQSQSHSQPHSLSHSDSNLTSSTAPAWLRSNTTSPPQTQPLPPYLSQSPQSFQTLEDILDDNYDRRNAVHSGHSIQLQGIQGVQGVQGAQGSSSEYSQSNKNRMGQNEKARSSKSRRKEGQGQGQGILWSPPALGSSPADQLVSAILDGNTVAINATIRSKGNSLSSGYWKDLEPSILPLHRAVSGLHFHSSVKLLLGAINTLIELGADVNLADKMGNTALQKAVTVCTSRSAGAVVRTLLLGGAQPALRNKEGDTPMLLECRRIRKASVEVIKALIDAGADPNEKTQDPNAVKYGRTSSGDSALTLILARCASDRSAALSDTSIMTREKEENSDDETERTEESTGESREKVGDGGEDESKGLGIIPLDITRVRKGRSKGQGQGKGKGGSSEWVLALVLLVKSGGLWNVTWRSPKGETQLGVIASLLITPPFEEYSAAIHYLFSNALGHGFSPTTEDAKGRNVIFAYCERMAGIPSSSFPMGQTLLSLLLDASGSNGLGGCDRSGITLFDIPELVPSSTLSILKPLLAKCAMKSLSSPSPPFSPYTTPSPFSTASHITRKSRNLGPRSAS